MRIHILTRLAGAGCTSDYDSVAIVAQVDDSLLMLPDIWRELGDSARE